jgi:hypothetical protein
VKTALTSILVTFAWLGWFAEFRAAAQQQYYATPPAAAGEALPTPAGTATPQPGPGNQPASPGAVQPPGGPPNNAADPTWMMDNGLWDGAAMPTACSICGSGSGTPPDWYTIQGVRVLSRSKTREFGISFQAPKKGAFQVEAIPGTSPQMYSVVNTATPTIAAFQVMGAKSINLDVAAGYEGTIGHYFCRDRNNFDHFVEFTFWGLNSWSRSASTPGYLVPIYNETSQYSQAQATLIANGVQIPDISGQEGSLRTPFPVVPQELPGGTTTDRVLSDAFNFATEHTIFYRSTMNNFEIDGRFSPRGREDQLVMQPNGRWRRECQQGTYMSYLYGIRYMQIDERFNLHSVSQITNGGVTTNGLGDYDILTHNDMLGIQIGADMTFRKCRWAWGVRSKLGTYINFANQGSSISAGATNLPNVSISSAGTKHDAALIGEVGFEASYKFRPNLVGRAGWDFMWITGVALAPDQLQFTSSPTNTVNVNGTIFSQGLTLGLEWLW